MARLALDEGYWEAFELQKEDIEFLYNHLLELETPLTSLEMVEALVAERIRREKLALERQRTSGGDLYQPKNTFKLKQKLIFPALNWQHGQVTSRRQGHNPEVGEFAVIQVKLDDGTEKEFASGIVEHLLNEPLKPLETGPQLDKTQVLKRYQEDLLIAVEDDLSTNPDFVRIAGRWFPKALLVDINQGHLNLAEAVLDMAGGGPLPTSQLLEQIELAGETNLKLLEFSLDLALQNDPRFDEVGPAGDVLWFLRRLEPPDVLEPPVYLRYAGIEHERSALSKEMLALEQSLDDELSPLHTERQKGSQGEISLLFPHWRSGTLPLSSRIRHLFPTAYEAPRIQFTLVDAETRQAFPGWVVREKRYVVGFKDWYAARGVMPGSIIRINKGDRPGEVVIHTDSRRGSREWLRTVLVGSDGGVVFALLKQVAQTTYDERLAIVVPDTDALDQVWTQPAREVPPFEKLVVGLVRELSKLAPQGHVHASELYAALNVVRRCPPAPILALLVTSPQFLHVGDLHYRISDSAAN